MNIIRSYLYTPANMLTRPGYGRVFKSLLILLKVLLKISKILLRLVSRLKNIHELNFKK